jgi:phospholipid transport system transporter-binding protein
MQPVRARVEAGVGSGSDAVLAFPAELTHEPAAAFARSLGTELARSSGAIVADVSALQQFDSSAIALLLECRRLAMQAGRGFSVSGSPMKLQQLAQLYGVDDLFPAAPRT